MNERVSLLFERKVITRLIVLEFKQQQNKMSHTR